MKMGHLHIFIRYACGPTGIMWFFSRMSSCRGPWWLSPWGGGADGEGSPPPQSGGSHGDTRWKAVLRIAINREHPDGISAKFIISCFVGHYQRGGGVEILTGGSETLSGPAEPFRSLAITPRTGPADTGAVR